MNLKRYFLISFLLILPILLFLGQYQPITSHECDNVFSSKIYFDFKNQLAAFMENEKKMHPTNNEEIVSFIDDISVTSETLEMRNFHEGFVKNLRSNIQDSPLPFFNRLNHWLFTDISLLPAMRQFLFSKFPIPKYKNDYSSVVLDFYTTISKDETFSYPFIPSFSEDGFFHGNLPSYLFTLENESKTKVLRMATCAKDTFFIHDLFLPPSKKVTEEFHQYVSSLRPLSHLYINLMKRKGKESRKTKCLEIYESNEPGLILITLDKDSSFYLQNDAFEFLNDAKEFKKVFLENLFKRNGNYFWSKKIEEKIWREECKNLLDKVHNDYFSTKEFLTVVERKDFIELSYLAMINSLLKQFKPSYLNISCKHSMDRGPSLTALLYVDHILAKGKKLEDFHENLLAMLFAPPLLIHNRKSHNARIKRFTSALSHLQNLYCQSPYTQLKNEPMNF